MKEIAGGWQMKKVYLVSVLWSVTVCAMPDKGSVITKVFFHNGALGDKIVFYFDGAPVCNQIPQKKAINQKDKSKQQLMLFLPLATVSSSDVQKSIDKLNSAKSKTYFITIQEVHKPIKGINIEINYDPSLIIVDSKSCDVVSGQRSLVISFHNKQTLQQINQATNQILHFASASGPRKQKKVVIDFGHGGSDSGAIGVTGAQEKDVTFQVGNKLVGLLKKRGYDVCVTRADDSFIALDERTNQANKSKSDLFLSIHANYSSQDSVQGVETYWAPRSELHVNNSLVHGWYKKFDYSTEQLAESVHSGLLKSINKSRQVVDRSVKKTISQVLIGTDMCSALVEIGFLSNPQEGKNLVSEKYQNLIAAGICDGIDSFYQKFS